jgi:hypothetical protein
MPTPFESAQLNLQLFDLRREPVLREARTWFLNEFNPESVAELAALVSGERNASFRMVLATPASRRCTAVLCRRKTCGVMRADDDGVLDSTAAACWRTRL